MKTLSIWALAAVLAIGVSACGGQATDDVDTTPPPAPVNAPGEPPMETPVAAAPVKATISAKVVEAGDELALEVVEATGEDGASIADWAGVTLTFASPNDSKGLATMTDLKGKTITVTGAVDAGAKTIVVETYEVAAVEVTAGGAVEINPDDFPDEIFVPTGSASAQR